MPRSFRPALCAALALVCAPAAHAQLPDSPFPLSKNPTMTLAVDATEAPRKLIHAHLSIPVKAGTQTLVFPEWIPGEHGPTGPIVNLSGLHFTAAGHEPCHVAARPAGYVRFPRSGAARRFQCRRVAGLAADFGHERLFVFVGLGDAQPRQYQLEPVTPVPAGH